MDETTRRTPARRGKALAEAVAPWRALSSPALGPDSKTHVEQLASGGNKPPKPKYVGAGVEFHVQFDILLLEVNLRLLRAAPRFHGTAGAARSPRWWFFGGPHSPGAGLRGRHYLGCWPQPAWLISGSLQPFPSGFPSHPCWNHLAAAGFQRVLKASVAKFRSKQ